MTFFNYDIYRRDKLVLEAMPKYTPMADRDQYLWWDLEEVEKNAPESWSEKVDMVPSLLTVLNIARAKRKSATLAVSNDYNVQIPVAARMIKTYIGFHPAYGSYLCQLGPYKSDGFWWGGEKIVKDAVGRFGYYILRCQRATPDSLSKALLANIAQYNKAYNVDLQPSDFELHLRAPTDASIEDKKRKTVQWEDVEQPINMNPESPEYKRLFNMNHPNPDERGLGPMIAADGSGVKLTKSGYEKILRGFFGEYYNETIREIANETGIEETAVVTRLLTDFKLLEKVYTVALQKYQQGVVAGQVQVGKAPPPAWKDGTLDFAPGRGQIEYTKIRTTKQMKDQFELTKEVLGYLERGVVDPEEIAKQLNAVPQRVKTNKNREKANLKRQPPLRPFPLINFTDQDVQMHMDIIDAQKEKLGEGATYPLVRAAIDDLILNTFVKKEKVVDPATGKSKMQAVIDPDTGKPMVAFGYDDLQTAFQMAMLFFSTVPRDSGVTGAIAGMPNAVAFSPKKDMHNFSFKDLAASTARPKLTEEERLADPEDLEKEIGALPEAGKELQAPIGEVEPLAEGEDPLAGMEEEVPNIPVPEKAEALEQEPEFVDDNEDIIATTVTNLIKLAEDLDKEGKDDASEEIHKIIRKYQKRIF